MGMLNLHDAFIKYNDDISSTRYEIGFVESDEFHRMMDKMKENSKSIIDFKVKWLKHHYKDRWFADPFILDVSASRIRILVEEYFYATEKGRISMLTIDKNKFSLLENKVILEKKTHLSFPIIKRRGNEIYVYPENSEAGTLSLYQLNNTFDKCDFKKTLVDAPLTDAVIYGDYIISTAQPIPSDTKIDIYKYDPFKNNYDKINSVVFNEKIARNGGDFFFYDETLFRPAQECNDYYGHCIVLQELTSMNDEWFFKEYGRVYSPHPIFNKGLHTFNVYNKGELCVIDVKGIRHPKKKKCVMLLRSLLYKSHLI